MRGRYPAVFGILLNLLFNPTFGANSLRTESVKNLFWFRSSVIHYLLSRGVQFARYLQNQFQALFVRLQRRREFHADAAFVTGIVYRL